ncbi:NADH:flavin oxidoreductase [Clostridium algidicarnis]|uniref:NADH:flavin oxidoreductase n=1 Tax=Clostridium algidicarnis TaxID=37659 RepID=UPI001C0DF14F|nr:NADH:flavin oxidoreductase [Clostridium algidicarnis]MBU3227074.1 NADH:flavin oxidoreductase [Clostridium algidicarnis]MBU3250599.1 NADH:flavin oxidoreductase [Clostridium algidicarnis]
MNIKDKVISNNIEFKNRVVMPPMATAKADDKGHITNEILKYYEEKTSCKLFSAVIVEHSYVDERGKANNNQTSISDDSDIEGMRSLAKVIKDNNSLAILQISHSGSAAKKDVTGMDPIAPSAIINPASKSTDMPVELNKDQIKDLKDKFIDAAERAKEAGFDGVELHSAHAYLLDQFLSPLTNKREDEYGGNIYGRIKLHLDIIKGIRVKLGEDYPIFLRMGAGDFMEGGLSKEDSVIAAMEFEKAGVNVLDISGGMCFYTIKDTRPGYFDVISKPIFEAVNIPVILTGGVKKGTDVMDILDRNVCDLVGIGRAVFKESDWMNRELKGLIKE